MRAAIHQLHYWPGLRFFAKMRSSDVFIYLDDVQFEKREFQNRNRIRTAAGWQYLTVPVMSKGRFSQKISEVGLDNTASWKDEHLTAIRTNYGRAAYFKNYERDIESLYSGKYSMLSELASATIEFLRSAFGIKTPAKRSSEFGVASVSTRRLIDLCLRVGADEYLSGAGGKNYLEERLFEENRIRLSWQDFKPAAYRQAFAGFEPDMSALDLLLNCGPDSVKYL